MARRKIAKENIRNIQRSHSYYITMPIGIIRSLGWQERQKVVVKQRGKTITIKDWPIKKKKYKLLQN